MPCCPNELGRSPAFVCQHIAAGVVTGRKVGFFWSAEQSDPHPDAWCSECEARRQSCGGEWVGVALDNIGAKTFCGPCYESAKRFHM